MAYVSVKNLVKSYETAKPILNDISLELDKGEVAVIIGPSGSGKSTFLRCLNALDEIDSGQIIINGNAIKADSKDIAKTREKVGMVFQSYELFPHLNVLDNVTIAPRKVQNRDKEITEKEALALLERVGLKDKAMSRPQELSGGQKQRIAIVRALMMNPDVLLLDEITASLDPETVSEVLEVVLDLAKEGMTMLIVTHEMDFARRVADKIYFFDSGKVVEESNDPQSFFKQPETERAKSFINTFRFE